MNGAPAACLRSRDGEVTFEKELSYNYSYFEPRNLGTVVTSVTFTIKRIWLKNQLISRYSYKIMWNLLELCYSNFVTPHPCPAPSPLINLGLFLRMLHLWAYGYWLVAG